jgi:hypothetical protein
MNLLKEVTVEEGYEAGDASLKLTKLMYSAILQASGIFKKQYWHGRIPTRQKLHSAPRLY